MTRLAKQVAIVTGAGGGLGRGICRSLAEAGACVVVSDLALSAAEVVASELKSDGFEALAVQTDVTNRQSCEQLREAALSAFGRLDILVCNAGVGGLPQGKGAPPPLIENITDEDWDLVMQVNVKGVFNSCRAVIAHFKEQGAGRIINISSVAGCQGIEFLPAYAASKAAVISFTQSLALQLAPFHVNANTICPGIIWTPMWEGLANYLADGMAGNSPGDDGRAEPTEVFDSVVKQMIPFGNPQQAQDIGASVVFLSAAESKEITGQALNVCGGMRMN